jgi:hypothetical protein
MALFGECGHRGARAAPVAAPGLPDIDLLEVARLDATLVPCILEDNFLSVEVRLRIEEANGYVHSLHFRAEDCIHRIPGWFDLRFPAPRNVGNN